MDPLILLAARENATWCDTVCRSVGVEGSIRPGLWASAARTPPLYPDAVTLDPATGELDVLGAIDSSPGASVKDSFCSLDLQGAGFAVLVEATWIAWTAPRAAREPWDEVGVEDWVAGHPDSPPFGETLLGDPTVRLLSRGSARFALHDDGSAVGVSNVVVDDDLWPAVVGEAARRHPGVPVVGYEHGEALAAALHAGAQALGPLRIWLR
ncbi:hypothetical protein EV189_3470 [Motilibacter rhizosphaerae]|uniref:Uncharacterized protein n=1 Tax=Motilibacter rhizosphaerae TaxID=598652 RepID=A0A4Q7NAN1_9ACTN|nr:hypothetical protein [Motilibacter rhizosphaerae]RZS79991.1 hypothetical protein EV189_3470 [Motilibacter rhizosphaerae]